MSAGHGPSTPPSTTPLEQPGGEPAPPATGEPAAPAAAPSAPPLGWRDVWQLPALLLATGLVAGGVLYVSRLPRENDFAGALDQVDELIAAKNLDEAHAILFERIAPHLDEANEKDRARFDASAADWISLARVGDGAVENDQQISDRYARAETGGLHLDRERLLRWAAALVHLGRTDEAMERVNRLDAEPGQADALRARIRRMVMERAWDEALRAEHPDFEPLLVALGRYRAEPTISAADEAWTAARQAEGRLALDRPRESADRLLVDLRRLESASPEVRGAIPPESFAELLSLLGRAYAQLGESDLARDNLERAITMCDAKSLPKGEALVLLGQLALQRGDVDDAEQRFESVLTDYAGEKCSGPALFGRAETRAARGEHHEALEDYRTLGRRIAARDIQRVDALDVVGSLVDRHDSLVVAGDLEQALEYVRLAAEFTPGRAIRPELLLRMATTARALADRMSARPDAADPEMTPRIGRLLKSAGDWFLAHSENPLATGESPDAWADSIWMAADCFERSGWSPDAIAAFRKFIDGSPAKEPRRPDAMFRVASILHAEGDLDTAASEYGRLIDEFALSPIAARATVPLARCLDGTGRRADAIARLQAIVDGSAGLKPEAAEYREALLELARLVVAQGDLARGVSLFEEALRRWPEDPRQALMHFQLGECRRGLAREDGRRLSDGALSPSQRASLDQQRLSDLETARKEFERAVELLDPIPESKLDPLEREALRLAYLYRADCLFDLARYREAIDLYEIAERRYSEHAVSMVALIQIVNAWHELGDAEHAATAHRRAEIRLNQLPKEAFDSPQAIFRRDAWERWLRTSPPGERLAQGETRPKAPAGAENPETPE